MKKIQKTKTDKKGQKTGKHITELNNINKAFLLDNAVGVRGAGIGGSNDSGKEGAGEDVSEETAIKLHRGGSPYRSNRPTYWKH